MGDPEAYKKSDKWVPGVLPEHLTPKQQKNQRKMIENWDTDRFHDMIEQAKRNGAKKLYCLGEAQRKFYEGHGFVTIKSLPWMEEYRPDGWDEDEFGKPSCYYMELRKGKSVLL